jgi:hypothetical protein
MEIHTIGIDLAKTVFHLIGLNAHGEVVTILPEQEERRLSGAKDRIFPNQAHRQSCGAFRSS